MGNCSQCLSRGKQEVWLTSLIGLAVSKCQVTFLFCNNLCKFPILNSVLVYSFIFLFLNSVLILSWSTKLTLDCARSHWHQSPASCYMLLLAQVPMSSHVHPTELYLKIHIFFENVWLTWNFGSIFAGTPAMFCFNGGSLWFSKESSGRSKICAPHRRREGRRSGSGSGT